MKREHQIVTRRKFLKLGAAMAVAPFAGRWAASSISAGSGGDGGDRPNFLILVFDTLSAPHLSLHGYRRLTTPNFERFAERSTVFHSHMAAGNFTAPSTASLFTGVYPWAHRALHLFGSMTKPYLNQNLFSLFKPHYTTTVYTHNELVEVLFQQLRGELHRWLPAAALSLRNTGFGNRLSRDRNVAVWAENVVRGTFEQPRSSPVLSSLLNAWERGQIDELEATLGEDFPRGVPRSSVAYSFLLEDAMEWIVAEAGSVPEPYLAYVHLYPPHYPYRPRHEFDDMFDDGWSPAPKAAHFFSHGIPEDELGAHRREYDKYIAYVDHTFGRLIDQIESSRLLDNTYLIVTSDHGEMFERGIWKHDTETLYQAVLHVPLLIAAPGQTRRRDISLPTSTVDLIPTLAHLANLPVPEWIQGRILPGFGDMDLSSERPIMAFEGKRSSKWASLTTATAAVRIGRYKLCQYLGYPGHENEVELYDLDNDPDERDDLATDRRGLAADLQAVLRDNLRDVVTAKAWD